MSRVITFYNQSGGVGKTSLCLNLGYTLSQYKHRILLIDMDPQGSLTVFMGLPPEELEETIYESVMIGKSLPIHHNIHGLDLVPANINLSVTEMRLAGDDDRNTRLSKALSPSLNQYDFILIDCPPSLGLLSYMSLVASTHVLVPVQTQYKAFQGTGLLLRTLLMARNSPECNLNIAGFVPTIYDARNSQDERTLQAIQEQLSEVGTVYPPVTRSTAFADATEHSLPLALYSPKHPAIRVFKKIAKDLEKLA